MRTLSLAVLGLSVLIPSIAHAQDPAVTDGDKYTVLLDNARVRVLSYADRPGERTRAHRHPAFVVYALAPFRRQLTLDDGRVMTRAFAAGEVLWSDGEAHVGENVGDTPTRVLMVEVKPQAGCPAAPGR